MYLDNLYFSGGGDRYMGGPILNKLKARLKKFKKLSRKEKFKRIALGALVGPLVAPVASVAMTTAATVAPAVLPIVATAKGTKALAKRTGNKKLIRAVNIANQGLIPGVGPFVQTASVIRAGTVAAAKRKAALQAVDNAAAEAAPQEVYYPEGYPSEEELAIEEVEQQAAAKSKSGTTAGLIAAGLAAFSIFGGGSGSAGA